MANDPPAEDVFTILLATDIHLGYEEKDRLLGDDSFVAFEEILHIAQENNVDFILLGGDLFHIAKPSSESMHKCMSLLREYCMGDRPISFEILSDQEKNFENTTQNVVNYEDPNINVSMPVFSIHGNHDDPVGLKNICSLDILSCAGLVNFFGKHLDLTDVTISPLLLKKGKTLLSVYGMSHIKDKRLVRLFDDGRVTFERPNEFKDDWFNICVLHQNRAARGPKEYLPEDQLPSFMDLIVWGHEHDCRIEPEASPKGHYFITQPGSSVATSLCEGEAIPKKVGLLRVFEKQFKLEAIQLQTVRPLIYGDICVSELDSGEDDSCEQLEERAEAEINNMLVKAQDKLTGHPQQPKLPLIRLRCFYFDENQMFNSVRFGQKFEDKVANPSNHPIVVLKKRVIEKKEKRDVLDTDVMDRVLEDAGLWDVKVEDYVKKYFQQKAGEEQYCMTVLTVAGLNTAVSSLVEKQHTNAIDEIVDYQIERMKKHFDDKLDGDLDEEAINEEIQIFNNQRGESEIGEILTQLNKTARKKVREPSNGHANGAADNGEDEDTIDDEVEDDVQEDTGSGRGRGRGRARTVQATRRNTPAARASPAARATRAPRGSRATSRAASTRSRGRGRGAPQQTLEESFANTSQISVVRTSARPTANRSRRMNFVDSDNSDDE